MKTTAKLTVILATLMASLGNVPAEEVTVKEFKITLAKEWKKQEDVKDAIPGVVAVWINPKSKKANAAMLASPLTKSVAKESAGMVASVKKQPGALALLEDRNLKLMAGGVARIVSVEVRAANPKLGIAAPMVFHSVYLPTKDGKSVTFKLQCAKKDLKSLKQPFESMVLSGLTEKTGVEGGAEEPATSPNSKLSVKKKSTEESQGHSK